MGRTVSPEQELYSTEVSDLNKSAATPDGISKCCGKRAIPICAHGNTYYICKECNTFCDIEEKKEDEESKFESGDYIPQAVGHSSCCNAPTLCVVFEGGWSGDCWICTECGEWSTVNKSNDPLRQREIKEIDIAISHATNNMLRDKDYDIQKDEILKKWLDRKDKDDHHLEDICRSQRSTYANSEAILGGTDAYASIITDSTTFTTGNTFTIDASAGTTIPANSGTMTVKYGGNVSAEELGIKVETIDPYEALLEPVDFSEFKAPMNDHRELGEIGKFYDRLLCEQLTQPNYITRDWKDIHRDNLICSINC